MLEPSVLIEMQITCNYQPENCSNTMNYFEVRFFFSHYISQFIQYVFFFHYISQFIQF